MRIAVGIIAFLFLAFGGWFYFTAEASLTTGMSVRIGALMAVICLAYPQLEKSKDKIPSVVIGILFICLVMIAVRPKISHIIITIGVLAIGVSTVMKFLAGIAGDGNGK